MEVSLLSARGSWHAVRRCALAETFLPGFVDDYLKNYASTWFQKTYDPEPKKTYAAALMKTIETYRKQSGDDFDVDEFLLVLMDVFDAGSQDAVPFDDYRTTSALFDELVDSVIQSDLPRELTSNLTEELFKKDGDLQSTLNSIMRSRAFLPLTYKLAELASPHGTVLSAQHRIISAAEALSKSKDLPQLSNDRFDYSLGGLRRHA